MGKSRIAHIVATVLLTCCALVATGAVAMSATAAATEKFYPKQAIEAYRKAIELKPELVSSIEDPKLKSLLGAEFLKAGRQLLDAGELAAAEKKLLIAGNFHESFELFLALARCYFRQERWEASLVLFKKALEKKPTDARTQAEMARAYLRVGKRDIAVRLFTEALEKKLSLMSFVDSPEVREEIVKRLVDEAKSFSTRDRPVEAASRLKVAVALDPNPRLFLEVGNAYLKAGDTRNAAKAFALAVREQPSLVRRIAPASMRKATGKELFDRGVEAYREGVFEQAEKLFLLSSRLDERGATIYNLADCAVRRKMVDKAVTLYEKAIELDPELVNAYLNLAVIYIDKNAPAKAVDKLRMLVNRKPATAEAYELLAKAFKALGDMDGAVGAYRSAVEYDVSLARKLKDPELRGQAAAKLYDEAKAHYGAKRFREAIDAIDCARALHDEGRFHFLAGNARYALGETRKALSCYKTALKMSPGKPEILNNIGNIYIELGDYTSAISSFRRAVKIDPDYAQAYNNLGICLKKKGLIREAIAAYKKALSIKPDYAAAHFNLGNAYAALGRVAGDAAGKG